MTGRWDNEHLHLPCSVSNTSKGAPIWDRIVSVLSKPIASPKALSEAFRALHPEDKGFDTRNVEGFLVDPNRLPAEEVPIFFQKTLPFIQALALKMPALFPEPVPLLMNDEDATATLSHEQAGCLLAHMFFCTMPSIRTFTTRDLPNLRPGSIDFRYWLGEVDFRAAGVIDTKLRILFLYFRRMSDGFPPGFLSFSMQHVPEDPDGRQYERAWSTCPALFSELRAMDEGKIADSDGALQIDFANEVLGGGCLETVSRLHIEGCVQEEIEFAIRPELNVGTLFCYVMKDLEAIVMRGSEVFAEISGYAWSLRFAKEVVDPTPIDAEGFRDSHIVAIDALIFRGYDDAQQIQKKEFLRELNKAYAGFMVTPAEGRPSPRRISTGNWGCGAFKGNKKVKAIIQWMAASLSGRTVDYWTFKDKSLADSLNSLNERFKKTGLTVGQVYKVITEEYARRRDFDVDTLLDVLAPLPNPAPSS